MDKLSQTSSNNLQVKNVIILVNDWYFVFKERMKLIASLGVLGSIIGFSVAYFTATKYKSELRFVVKNEGSVTGMTGMLGGLGAVLGGSTMGSPLERTIEIASSDRIVGSVLLTEVNLSGKNEILANSLIRINGLRKVWRSDSLLSNVEFNSLDTSIESMNFSKRKALKKLEDLLIPKSGKGIISRSFDKKSGVVTLTAIHQNEDFAIVLTKEIYYKLRDFYVEQMITSAANNVVVLQRKVDSIKSELSRVQSTYARATDKSFGLLFQEDKVELRKLAVREQMLLAMYAEVQKNLETFKFMNDSAIPSLTVIDMPYSPLKKIYYSKILFTLVGFFLTVLISFLYFLFKRWYKNLMAA
jgi:uncharacterized protein involved in exopolysaccharide biosynthesis